MVSSRQTAAVAGLSGAAVGTFDLSGNVWEWVGDWYEPVSLAGVGVQGPASGPRRVLRGGSWRSVPKAARGAIRYGGDPGIRIYDLGVRLLRTAP